MKDSRFLKPNDNSIDYYNLSNNQIPVCSTNVLINPINELTYSNYSNNNSVIVPSTTNHFQNDWLQSASSNTSSASTIQLQNTIVKSTTNNQDFNLTTNYSQPNLIPPIYENNLIKNNENLIYNSKKPTVAKLKSNQITVWPINRKTTSLNQFIPQTQLNLKFNQSSFYHKFLTCAFIFGIIVLLFLVVSSIYVYNSYANRVSKSNKLYEIELCSSIECHLGAICKVDFTYKQPFCDCESFQCDKNLIQTGNTNIVNLQTNQTNFICGSDNKTYSSICELKKSACWRQKRIDIIQYSPCKSKNKVQTNQHHSNQYNVQNNPKNKIYNDLIIDKDDTFYTNLLDPAITINANLLANDPLAKQEACNQLSCNFASTCQIRNVSLSSFVSKNDHSNKKSTVTRLVCECPAKCSLYDQLIAELVAEANSQMTSLSQNYHYNHHQLNENNYYSKIAVSKFDNANDEYYSHANHQSASNTFNFINDYERTRNNIALKLGAVCGSNAKDYKNLCELAKSSCASQTRISIKYFGLCDPCASHQCAEDEICKLKPNREPYCDCGHRKSLCSKPQKYQNNPDTVCGSDGNTYLNECVLRRHTCVNERNVTIISNSECVKGSHPCHKIHCNAPMECHVSSVTNQASCECSQQCGHIYKPICGSDNHTYDSACHLSLETCLRGNSQPRLGLAHAGPCGSNKQQSIKKHPIIVLNEENHNDIGNQLTKFQSINQQCAPNTCPNYGICLLAFLNGVERVTCECPQCSLTRSLSSYQSSNLNSSQKVIQKNFNESLESPVCGSDSITYASECELRKFSCEQQKLIKIKHKGTCRGCEQLKCKHYALCETTASGASECVCPEACEKNDAQVCGSDGVTYENECELRVRSCKLQKLILVRSIGSCNICEKIKCKFGAQCKNGRCTCSTFCDKQSDHEELICASNGRTFANDCDMKRYSCLHQTNLSIIHLGECSSENLNLTEQNLPFNFEKKFNSKEVIEAGVRLINDEENEDEFNVILRQQSAEDDINMNGKKSYEILNQNYSEQKFQNKNNQKHNNHLHNKHRYIHKQLNKNSTQFINGHQQNQFKRHQKNQLCRKLRCKFGSVCKLIEKTLNITNFNKDFKNEKEILNLEAFCDCSNINCEKTEKKSIFAKEETLCGSDGKLYLNKCQIKEQSCKLQQHLHLKQRKFCDQKLLENSINQTIIDKVINVKEKIVSNTEEFPEENCQCKKLSLDNDETFCSRKCNQKCLPGFWGLEKIKMLNDKDLSRFETKQSLNEIDELNQLFDNYEPSDNFKNGNNFFNCLPCECNNFGSLNFNCNQSTGICKCKYGVLGDKCDYCDGNKELTEQGCISKKVAKTRLGHCREINCEFGSFCELIGQAAQCKCDKNKICESISFKKNNLKICGSNGNSYLDECELKMHSCILQEKIDIKFYSKDGIC